MSIRYAEDYSAGNVFDLGTYDVTREEIIEFLINTTLSRSTLTTRRLKQLFSVASSPAVG